MRPRLDAERAISEDSQSHGVVRLVYPDPRKVERVRLCVFCQRAFRVSSFRVASRDSKAAEGAERSPRLFDVRAAAPLLDPLMGKGDGLMLDERPNRNESRGAKVADGTPAASACRGVRGAITVGPDPSGAALEAAVGGMLDQMLTQNQALIEDIAALVFTLQGDLGDVNPAAAARARGFDRVPLLMVREHGGDTRLPHCIRALMLVNSHLSQQQIQHVYLGGAQRLRPDLVAERRERP